MFKSNQGDLQRSLMIKARLLPALVGVWAVLAASSHSATIQLDVTMAAGTSINSSAGTLVSGATAYVGSFFNGSSAMTKSEVAALWTNTRASFTTLWSRFVSVANAVVSSGGFAISTRAEVTNVAGKRLVGKDVYVLVVDNAASPTGFLLLAADGTGAFDNFANPADIAIGEDFTSLELAGEASTFTVDGMTYDQAATTTVVGTAGTYNSSTDLWTMASIPGGVSTPTITGAATALAFTTTYGTASSAQNFSISGSNLTGNLVATAPAGFEVSSDGASYGNTATFGQSGGSASGTLRVRLAATAAVSGSYNSQNIVLSSTGAASINLPTASSGNLVTAKVLTISGLAAANKDVDGTITATVTGTPTYVGLVNSENFSVSGSVTWAFPDSNIGDNKTLIRTGSYSAPSGNYTVTQPILTASIRALPTLRLLTLGEPAYAGVNTTVTHTFSCNANGSYVLEYKSSLADAWKTMNVIVSNNNNFSVTFINSGVNTVTDWKNRMFFRVRNS